MSVVREKEKAIHLVRESASPPSEMTTTMWCGATTIELFYGPWVPDLDFFYERESRSATCAACLDAFRAEKGKR